MKVFMKFVSFLAAAAVVILSGCAAAPPMNFSVPNVGVSQKKIDAELKSMTVTIARPDEKTGDLPMGMDAKVPQIWQTSITEALNKMTIFQDDSTKKVNLSVKILKLDMPAFGASMTTTTEARYEISDRKSGDIIYTQNISSTGTTPFDHSLIGVIRVLESLNRAVQNNISQFLLSLETVDASKPMFPVKIVSTNK